MWAAAEGHAEVVKLLLARGADPALSSTASTKPERRPPGGMTALLFAARQGKLDAARALLDGGADVNQAGADTTSPLLIAVVNGHYDVASLLHRARREPEHRRRERPHAALCGRSICATCSGRKRRRPSCRRRRISR